jgi:hypothetical protein
LSARTVRFVAALHWATQLFTISAPMALCLNDSTLFAWNPRARAAPYPEKALPQAEGSAQDLRRE